VKKEGSLEGRGVGKCCGEGKLTHDKKQFHWERRKRGAKRYRGKSTISTHHKEKALIYYAPISQNPTVNGGRLKEMVTNRRTKAPSGLRFAGLGGSGVKSKMGMLGGGGPARI